MEFEALECSTDSEEFEIHGSAVEIDDSPGRVSCELIVLQEIPFDDCNQLELMVSEGEDLPRAASSPTAESTDPPQQQEASPEWSPPPGPSLQDTQLQSACLPFLQWMCQPPITQIEALIKARRVKAMTQLQPIKLNLRFVFGLLMAKSAIDSPDLRCLTSLEVCKALSDALDGRKVGSARIHAVFLLVKKVLVYLASIDSAQQRQFLAPTCHASYVYVESICSDNSHRRKQEARNRAVLGVQTSKLLHKSQPASRRGMPSLPAGAFDMPSMLGPLETTVEPPPRTLPAAPIIVESAELSPNELTQEELKKVAAGAMTYLRENPDGAYFMHHLVAATLSLGLAPRSQVLKQLRIGSTFVKEADGRYWIRMLAELNKNGRPTVFSLPNELTAPFDHYFEAVRPRLLQLHEVGEQHDYVFFKKNGTAPRAEFSELTSLATQQLIGRPVNAHAFRSAVVTTFYQTGASQSQMDVLASIMAHDPSTARNYYFRPQMAKAAVDTGNRMVQALSMSERVMVVGDW